MSETKRLLRCAIPTSDAYEQLITDFEKRIGYVFKNRELLRRAFVSRSYAEWYGNAFDHKNDMEQNGDRLLKNMLPYGFAHIALLQMQLRSRANPG